MKTIPLIYILILLILVAESTNIPLRGMRGRPTQAFQDHNQLGRKINSRDLPSRRLPIYRLPEIRLPDIRLPYGK